ncbi:MAG: AraC family transcriptional regulator [Desulfovibrio sp.]|nr:AraC family transcriptional regulator [Desulfovibrio sp.]
MFWSFSLTLAESTAWHAHDVYEFVLCRSGSGLLLLDNGEVALAGGRTVLVAPRVRHRYAFGRGETVGLKVVCLTQGDMVTQLSPTQIAALMAPQPAGCSMVAHQTDVARLWDMADMIPDGIGRDEGTEVPVAWGAIGLLLAFHVRDMQAGGDAGARHHDAMRGVRGWLDAHLDQPVDLDGLAARFGLSRSLLTREFRRHAGASVVAYVNTRRLEKAGGELAESDRGIAEVALRCGFASLPNFYRRFRALYGVTPAEFRRVVAENAGGNAGVMPGMRPGMRPGVRPDAEAAQEADRG